MSQPKKEVYWYTKNNFPPERTAVAKAGQAARLASRQADVVVVGGGMAGLSAAQQLREAGQDVILLESQFCGGGASGKSSGFITPDSENQLTDLVEDYGEEEAKKLRKFANGGVELIRRNIEKHSIDCDYRSQDSLALANSEKAQKKVKEEHQARLDLGYDSQLYSKTELLKIVGSERYFGGVRYGKTFGINPYLYCRGLKAVLEKDGVKICEGIKVLSVQSGRVTAEELTLEAKHIVVATDRFLPDLKIEKRNIYHVQTFLAVSAPLRPEQIKKIFPDGELMVWDSDLIYQYFRLVEGNRLLFGASNLTHTYKRGESKNWNGVLLKMKRYLKNRFQLDNIIFEYTWPGLIGISKDLMPIAGEDSERRGVYYTSAAAGLPWAAALGGYLAEKIMNGRNDLDKYFRADRHYPVGPGLQAILSKPPSFAISHGIVEYF